MRHAVVVPSTLALLPAYAGLADPVAELRRACLDAVGWLASRHPDGIRVAHGGARPDNVARGVPEPAGERIARHLLDAVGFQGTVGRGDGLLVVANGSARRTEKAPGHLDPRAAGFDEALGAALGSGDAAALAAVDEALAVQLWCHDVPAFRALATWASSPVDAQMDDRSDAYGVMYWVVRWTCGS